jgi:putative Holliday junction resolvase
MRIMGVDPGEKNIGIAISDATGSIANPLKVIKHVTRAKDAAAIAELAAELEVERIVVGQSLQVDGTPSYQGRQAARLAGAIRAHTQVPVSLWDEGLSTQTARQARIDMGVPRAKRRGHLDELAATVILQSYLDAHASE